MKVKGVVLDAVGARVRVEELDLDEPREGEVLVQMKAAGVCHSDQHVVTGAHPGLLPTVLGHEGAGEVVGVGPGVERVAISDRVALNWLPSCQECFYCKKGQHELCREVTSTVWSGFMPDGTSRISLDGETLYHYSGVSTWAEYMVVQQECCQVIDARVPYEVAALIGCAVATGVGAARYTGNVGEGDSVAVVGAGGVGLSVVMGAALAGARRIIAIDREPSKEDLALALGATDFVVANDHAIAKVRALTEGRGADVVFEAIGNPRVQEMWIDGVRPGGTLVLVGIPSTQSQATFVTADLSRFERTIKGSYFAATDTARAINDLSQAFLEGRLPVDRMISSRVPIEEIQDALDIMLTGQVGRSVIVFD